jgi:hypothetical protein
MLCVYISREYMREGEYSSSSMGHARTHTHTHTHTHTEEECLLTGNLEIDGRLPTATRALRKGGLQRTSG